MSTADWWAARLRGQPTPPPAVTQYATTYASTVAVSTPAQPYTQPATPVTQQLDVVTYKAQLAQALREKRISPEVAAAEWAKLGGGDGAKFEPNGCPECYSPRYFERKVLRTMNDQLRTMSKAPAPMCMDCGYSGAVLDLTQYAASHPAPPSGTVMAVVDKKAKVTKHLTVDELIAEVRREHGDGSIVRGVDREVLPRLTTGAIGFDLMLGGGMPAGEPNEVIGEFSSGKTSFVLKMIAANHALDPEFLVLWVASEPFVEPWAVTAGCDLDRIVRFKSQHMEAVYDYVVKFTANRAVDMIVLDSLPALTPMDEYEGDMADVLPALAARVNNKFFRKLGMSSLEPAGRRRAAVHHDRGQPVALADRRDSAATLGPRRAARARTSPTSPAPSCAGPTGSRRPSRRLASGSRSPPGRSRTSRSPPQRTALVDFYFDRLGGIGPGSYDVALDIMLAAMELDIIRRGGSTYRFNDQSWKGKEPVLQSLREDLDLRRLVYSETMRAAGLAPDPALAGAEEAPDEEAVTRPAPQAEPQAGEGLGQVPQRTCPAGLGVRVGCTPTMCSSERFLVENKRTDNERSITIKADDLRQLRINATRRDLVGILEFYLGGHNYIILHRDDFRGYLDET